jgi:magnesium-transporting ATPase (P-type)
MVLADDNFATIVTAIQEGRAIFDNMRKFIVYIFAHLSPEALPYILFALFRTPLPLTVMQILAIDLGTETMPALALGIERPEPDVMSRPPRRRTERLLDMPALVRGYGFLGLLTTAAVLGAFFLFLQAHGWQWQTRTELSPQVAAAATTVTFLGIVVMQVGNAFACRAERASAFSLGLFSNRLLLWGIGFELLFAAGLIYLPFLQPLFGTAPIHAAWWAALFLCIIPVFLMEEARKWIVRRRERTAEPSR